MRKKDSMNRRKMLKSLATIFGVSCAPSLFIPKFEPVKWKIVKPNYQVCGYRDYIFNARDFYGKWQFVLDGPIVEFVDVIKPEPPVFEEVVLFKRED